VYPTCASIALYKLTHELLIDNLNGEGGKEKKKEKGKVMS
jgi:hypothetical protein